MNEYEGMRRVGYDSEGNGTLVFCPVCPKCGRFVKADDIVKVNGLGEYIDEPNADCKHCGRVEMPFEGFF